MSKDTTSRKTDIPPPPDITNIRNYGERIRQLLVDFQAGKPHLVIMIGSMLQPHYGSAQSLVTDILEGRFRHARPGAQAEFITKSDRAVFISLETGIDSAGNTVTNLFLH